MMEAALTMTTPNGPVALIQSLIATLREEHDGLLTLREQFGHQLDALRANDSTLQEQAMHAANETVHQLGQLRSTRERQARLLSRVLKLDTEAASLQDLANAVHRHPDMAPYAKALLEARAAVRAEAQQTRQTCEELDFALQYAVRLGREMLHAMQDLDVPPPARVYTAAGHTSKAVSPRSLLNRVG